MCCAAALSLLTSAAPGFAQGLPPITLDLNLPLGGSSVGLSTVDVTNLVPALVPGLTLNLDVPAGFAVTSAACTGASLVSAGANAFQVVTATADVSNLSCTFSTVNTLLGSLETIVPLLTRQNDFLMSLDLGLDRQIDLLSDAGGGGNDGFAKPSGLGGPGLGFGGNALGDTRMRLGGETDSAPTSFSFATSLNQMRQAQANYPQPYGLGLAGPRPAPAAKFDVWAEGYLAHFRR